MIIYLFILSTMSHPRYLKANPIFIFTLHAWLYSCCWKFECV